MKISMRRKNPKNEPTFFLFPLKYKRAKYTSKGALSISDNGINLDTGKIKLFKGNSAWNLFFEHATFREILSPYLFNDEFYSREGLSPVPKSPDLPSIKDEAEQWSAYLKYAEQMLKSIRDDPRILSCNNMTPNPASETLIIILKTARWERDKIKAKQAINLLKDFLIPSSPGGKRRPLPPSKILKLKIELSKKLARHLSDKCKKAVDYPLKENKNPILDKDAYKDLLKKIPDERIKTLKREDLSLLIFKPAKFSEKYIEDYYKVSRKTMRRDK